jgi:hypothetical protein
MFLSVHALQIGKTRIETVWMTCAGVQERPEGATGFLLPFLCKTTDRFAEVKRQAKCELRICGELHLPILLKSVSVAIFVVLENQIFLIMKIESGVGWFG